MQSNTKAVATGRSSLSPKAGFCPVARMESWEMPTVEKRFWSKVDRRGPDECWPWIGGTRVRQYGMFCVNGGKQLAHRFAWTLVCGEIPDGLAACHKCDNPTCCNPSHLFLGSQSDNVDDCIGKGRWGHVFHGEKNGRARLTAELVRLIRSRRQQGETCKALAVPFGVSPQNVHRIITNQTWRNV